MITALAKIKVSSDDSISIPKDLFNLFGIQEDSEVLIYGQKCRITLSTQPLSEEELTNLDMMQWSMDIDKKLRR